MSVVTPAVHGPEPQNLQHEQSQSALQHLTARFGHGYSVRNEVTASVRVAARAGQ